MNDTKKGARKERIKSDLELTKSFLLLLATAFLGMFGFAIANIDTLSQRQINLGAVGLVALTLAFLIFFLLYIINCKKLEECDV